MGTFPSPGAFVPYGVLEVLVVFQQTITRFYEGKLTSGRVYDAQSNDGLYSLKQKITTSDGTELLEFYTDSSKTKTSIIALFDYDYINLNGKLIDTSNTWQSYWVTDPAYKGFNGSSSTQQFLIGSDNQDFFWLPNNKFEYSNGGLAYVMVDGGASAQDIALILATSSEVSSVKTNGLGISRVETPGIVFLIKDVEVLNLLDATYTLPTGTSSSSLPNFDWYFGGGDYRKTLNIDNQPSIAYVYNNNILSSTDFLGGTDTLVIGKYSQEISLLYVSGKWGLYGNGASAQYSSLEYIQFLDKAFKLNADGTKDEIPFIDFSKEPANQIFLSISSSAVAEDGNTNLIFTFSRTGSITSALTVNYTVDGSATLGTDYTGISATGTTKTITFSAGAATTTVTVDPTADTTVESDETVSLTLRPGSDYSIATNQSVIAIISDDERPYLNGYGFRVDSITVAEGGRVYLPILLPASKGDVKYTLDYQGNAWADPVYVTTNLSTISTSYSGVLPIDTIWNAEIVARDNSVIDGARLIEVKLSASDPGILLNNKKISVYILDNDAPTYSLTPSSASINEGSTLTTTVATTNVASGTTLYYALSGTGISAADFSAGALTGQVTTGTNGTATFSHTLASDLTTEGTETLQIKLFSDSARISQVGDTASVTISDTSTTPAPTYSLTPSSASINEGSTLTTTVATTNVASGTTLYYTLLGTGISAADFSAGALTGQVTTGTNGSASFSHTLANDRTEEGTETLQIKLFSDSARNSQVGSTASITISDTSSPPVQTVYTASSQLSYTPGNTVSLPLLYTTNTADQNLTGLTLNVHYNSSLLTPHSIRCQ